MVAALLALCGCEGILSPSQSVTVVQQLDGGCGCGRDDDGNGSADIDDVARTFACVRVERDGLASECRLEWSGGGAFDVRATRSSDGASDSLKGATTGTLFDPGCPSGSEPLCGAGGGSWTFDLLDGAEVVASTSTRLDS